MSVKTGSESPGLSDEMDQTSRRRLDAQASSRDREDGLTLRLLEAIESRSDLSQRHLATRMGVALGLANAYLRRCIRKGLVKAQQAPANRYLYYLTPRGFSEKGRLTAQYLSYSFHFYKEASESVAATLHHCVEKGWTQIGLCGASDLAEITVLRAWESALRVTTVADVHSERSEFLSIPLARSWSELPEVDAWIVTDLSAPQDTYDKLCEVVSAQRILYPSILGIRRAK